MISDNSLDVFPGNSVNDVADGWLSDTEIEGQFLLTEGTRPDCENIRIVESSHSMSFSHRPAITFYSFSHVLGLITKMKMDRVDADGSIALMENEKATSGTVVKPIGDHMGQILVSDIQLAVPGVFVDAASPVPASFDRRLPRHEPSEGLGFGKAPGSFGSHCSNWFSGQGVTVLVPSLPMRVAPPPCSNRPVTFRDRAIHNQYFIKEWS